MSIYTTKGTVSKVTCEGDTLSFQLTPVAPYLFEEKGADGKSTIQRILLVVDSKAPKRCEALAVAEDTTFHLNSKDPHQSLNFASLLLLKVNRCKILIYGNYTSKGG